MKRRDFIGTAMIGGMSIVPGTSIFGNLHVHGANDKIVLAIIGAGDRGRGTIINCCKINENVVIKTVCDVNDVKAAKTIAQVEKDLGYKPNHSRHIKEVLNDKDIDAVWIST